MRKNPKWESGKNNQNVKRTEKQTNKAKQLNLSASLSLSRNLSANKERMEERKDYNYNEKRRNGKTKSGSE